MKHLDRRDFIKVAGLTSLGMGFSKFIPSPLAWAEDLSKVGLVCGHLRQLIFPAPLLMGIETGLFKKKGFDLNVKETAGGGEAARVFAASKDMDLYFATPPAVIKAILQGEKWKIVSNFTMANITFVVLGDSPLKTAKDLKGKKIGITTAGGTVHLITMLILEKLGFTLDDVKVIHVGALPAIWTAMKGGMVDCGSLDDPFATKYRLSGEMRTLFNSVDYVQDIILNFIVAKESFVKEKQELLKKFLLTLEESTNFFLDANNKKKVAELFTKGTDFPVEIILRAIEDAPKSLWKMGFTPAMLKQTEDGMMLFKMITEPIPWSKIIDQSCLPEKYRIELPR